MNSRSGCNCFMLGMCLLMFLAGCSSARYVPAGEFLLDDVRININDSTGLLKESELISFVRQRPNNKFFYLAKLRLGVYNMSGADSTKKINKWIRSLGEPPVIYDSVAMAADSLMLTKALRNAGFLFSQVKPVTVADTARKKIKITYDIFPGTPHRIKTIGYNIPDSAIREIILRDSSMLPVQPGVPLDRNLLEQQREMIISRLQNRGYWAFTKDRITFNADTTESSHLVDLTMSVRQDRNSDSSPLQLYSTSRYIIRDISYYIDCIPGSSPADSTIYNGIRIYYGSKKHLLRPYVLSSSCFLSAGHPYSAAQVSRTYSALGRLPILKFINIRLIPAGKVADTGLLDVRILLTSGQSQSFSAELEGTNSEGDLGAALALRYTHRNIGRGSETLNIRIRGSYEAISGDLSGFIHNRATESGIEGSLTFPSFKAPLVSESFRRKINASTEIHFSLNYQERPEYTRIISSAGWSYKWSERRGRRRFTLTPIDINYVFLPKSTYNFIDQIAPDNPLLRYSYEDHFIMRAGFNFYYTTKRSSSLWHSSYQKNVWTLRANTEIAGNLLFALSSLFNYNKNFHQQPYKIFGIHYSQYAKAEGDFSYLHSFNPRHSLALHAGLGIGVPYGNSSILPFEKRFYGGGANGVRGWEVRTLGPGRFPGNNSRSDFINQCGDIRIEISAEYRAKLFWVIEGALFVDAGNIWTIHNYENQPGGFFRFNSFYKEFATAYGIGLRLDFNYFLIRLDLGMKAHDPALNRDPWPLIHPNWRRDHAFHFSIGYPF